MGAEMTVGQIAERLIVEATPVATELCQNGAIACLPCVVSAQITQTTMIVTAGLLQGLLFRIGYAYEESNERKPPVWLLNRVKGAIVRAGDLRFSNGFSNVWKKADTELHTEEAIRRIDADGQGDPFRQRASAMVECVDWTVRELNSGVASNLMTSNRLLFQEIVSVFSIFSLRNESLVDLGALSAKGTENVDLDRLPPSRVKYDVFISYRRSDGLASARLLKQELERRGNRCFLDVDTIDAGQYNPQIFSALKSSDNIVFLMTNEAVSNLDDPDNPVRIELETACKLGREITVVAAPGTSRGLEGIELPKSLEHLRGLHKYRLDIGELFEKSVDIITTEGFSVRRSRLVKLVRHYLC